MDIIFKRIKILPICLPFLLFPSSNNNIDHLLLLVGEKKLMLVITNNNILITMMIHWTRKRCLCRFYFCYDYRETLFQTWTFHHHRFQSNSLRVLPTVLSIHPNMPIVFVSPLQTLATPSLLTTPPAHATDSPPRKPAGIYHVVLVLTKTINLFCQIQLHILAQFATLVHQLCLITNYWMRKWWLWGRRWMKIRSYMAFKNKR